MKGLDDYLKLIAKDNWIYDINDKPRMYQIYVRNLQSNRENHNFEELKENKLIF